MHDNILLFDCDKCDGTGKEKGEPEGVEIRVVAYRKCTACNGTGKVEITWDEFEEMKERERIQDDD